MYVVESIRKFVTYSTTYQLHPWNNFEKWNKIFRIGLNNQFQLLQRIANGERKLNCITTVLQTEITWNNLTFWYCSFIKNSKFLNIGKLDFRGKVYKARWMFFYRNFYFQFLNLYHLKIDVCNFNLRKKHFQR